MEDLRVRNAVLDGLDILPRLRPTQINLPSFSIGLPMNTAALGREYVGKIVSRRPQLAKIFEQFEIDYCCRGNSPLSDACREKNLDLQTVLDEIDKFLQSGASACETDWNEAPLSDLVNHIVETHHAYLRTELPRLTGLIQKVRKAHGDRHPELQVVDSLFANMRSELESHMLKEENILFPAACALEAGSGSFSFPFGTVRNPIRMMEHEHEYVGDALRSMRKLTSEYRPPQDACPTFRVMLESLQHLEQDLHEHIHKENNILFPRAIELERVAVRN